MNNSEFQRKFRVSDFNNLQFLGKMQKLICKLPKYFANCKL